MIQLACQCAHSLIQELNDYVVEGTGCTLRLHIGLGAGQAGGEFYEISVISVNIVPLKMVTLEYDLTICKVFMLVVFKINVNSLSVVKS